MFELHFLVIIMVGVVNGVADINSTANYVFWQKIQLSLYDAAYPGRAILDEWEVGRAAAVAVGELSCDLRPSLAAVVTFQDQFLAEGETIMAGTDAQGCVDGISHYMEQVIDNAVANYNDCTADAVEKLNRLQKSWDRLRLDYLSAFQRALRGVDYCAASYPDLDSMDKLVSCVTAVTWRYYLTANLTQRSLVPSPSMAYFQDQVLGCVNDAVTDVVDHGHRFLDMMIDCAQVSGNLDIDDYSQQLKQWKGYNNTLSIQVAEAQTNHLHQVSAVLNHSREYYQRVKESYDNYAVEPRGLMFYVNRMTASLGYYYDQLGQAAENYSSFPTCIDNAKSQLDSITYSGAEALLRCDAEIVNYINVLVSWLTDYVPSYTDLLSSTGNAAILSCFFDGYIFAPNTIKDCINPNSTFVDYELKTEFAYQQRFIATLSYYETFFTNSSYTPCHGFSWGKVFLDANVSSYYLNRCIYKSTAEALGNSTTPLPGYTTVRSGTP